MLSDAPKARQGRRGRLLLGAFAMLATLALASCGSEQDEAASVKATVAQLQEAYVDGDLSAACRLLSFDAKRQVGEWGHGLPTFCANDLREPWMNMRRGRLVGYPTDPEVVDVAVEGRRAQAVLAVGGARRAPVELVEERGRWHLDDLFGARDVAYHRPRTPAPSGDPVRAFDMRSRRCPHVDASDPSRIRGGCAVEIRGEISLIVRSAFGAFRFARCRWVQVLRVDGDGRTWAKPLWATNSGPCGDVDFCLARGGGKSPWSGRIERDGGGLVNRADVCIRNCLGQYQGEVAFPLARDSGGHWRLGAGQHVGGGLELSGEWSFPARELALRAET